MKGNILKDLYFPQIKSVSTNGKKKGKVTFEMMERNIRKIAYITRTDDPFNEARKGDVILRKRVVVA